MEDPLELRDTDIERVGVPEDVEDLLVRPEGVCVELDVKEEEPETDTDQESLGDPDELGVSYEEPLDDPDPEELLLEDWDGWEDTELLELGRVVSDTSLVRVDVCVSRELADELLLADKLRDIVFIAE